VLRFWPEPRSRRRSREGDAVLEFDGACGPCCCINALRVYGCASTKPSFECMHAGSTLEVSSEMGGEVRVQRTQWGRLAGESSSRLTPLVEIQGNRDRLGNLHLLALNSGESG